MCKCGNENCEKVVIVSLDPEKHLDLEEVIKGLIKLTYDKKECLSVVDITEFILIQLTYIVTSVEDEMKLEAFGDYNEDDLKAYLNKICILYDLYLEDLSARIKGINVVDKIVSKVNMDIVKNN